MSGRWDEKCEQLGRDGGQRGVLQLGGSDGGHGQVLEEEVGQGEDELLGGEGCVRRRIQGLGGWEVEEKGEGEGMDQVVLIQHELVDGPPHVQDGGLDVERGEDVEQGEGGDGGGQLGEQEQVLGGEQHWCGQPGGGGQWDGECGGQLDHDGQLLDADEAGGADPRGAAQP